MSLWFHERMEIGVLGQLVVHHGGVDVTPHGQRPRDVLTVLLQRQGHSVAPEVILDLVWGERASSLSATVVHTVVARLRGVIGSDSVETDDVGYRLSPALVTDAEGFTRLVRLGGEAAAAGRSDDAVALYRRALATWRGPTAYAGVTDDLVLADRARLDEQRALATEGLVESLLEVGAESEPHHAPSLAGEALQLALDLAQVHPLRERPHGLAMVAAYRSGRQAQALEIYRLLRRRLRSELGVDPDPRTAALEVQVLAQDPALWRSAASGTTRRGDLSVGSQLHSADPGSSSSGPGLLASTVRPRSSLAMDRSCLPTPATPTIGRDREISQVMALLAEGHRLVSVVGPGGVGKSRLLAEVGLRLEGGEALTYLDLSGVGDVSAEELAEALAASYGILLGADDTVSALADGLRPAVGVVLVDEAEGVVEAVSTVLTRLLDDCAGLRFVITTRVPLDVLGESRIRLQPLACPAPDASPEQAARSPAVRLLAARLRDQGLDLHDGDVERLSTIARRIDGLPLALELAAGHASSLSLDELVDLVDAPLQLTTTERGRRPRHRSLRDTVLWSVDRLPEAHRGVLRRLGVFAGAFDLASARAVVGSLEPSHTEGNARRGARLRTGDPDDARDEVAAALRSLVREALVQVDRRGPRMRMRLLRTVRDLAIEGLQERSELTAAHRRHREWFSARWRGSPLHDALLRDVGESYDDYVEALRDAVEMRDSTTVGDLLITLWRRWLFTEATGPALRWSQRVLDAGLLTTEQRARVLVLQSGRLLPFSIERASADLDEAFAGLGSDPDWLALYLTARCVEHYLAADLDAAAITAETVVRLARSSASHHVPEALAVRAAVAAARNRTDDAIADAEEAWALVGAAPSATHFAAVVPKIALALTDAGHPRRALTVLETAIEGVTERLGLRPPHTMLVTTGWAALGTGDGRRALHWFALALHDPVGRLEGLASAENLCGAGGALALIGAPGADEVLAGAADLAHRHRLTLSPWQQDQLPVAVLPPTTSREPLVESSAAIIDRLVRVVVNADVAAGDNERRPTH